MIIAMALWGGGWPALKIVTEHQGVEVVTFWRFFIMTLAFVPILVWWRRPIRLSKQGAAIAVGSALMNMAFMFLSFWGVMLATAGGGGVIATTLSPVLTLLLAILFFKTKVMQRHWIGLLIGLFGGAMMLEVWHIELIAGGNGVLALSALVWAVLTLLSQRSHHHMEPIHYSFFLGLFAMVMMFWIALPFGIFSVFDEGWQFWVAMLYLGVFGQTVASTIYFYASGKMGSGHASSYMFLVPLFALLSSYLVLGEIPSFWLVAGGSISLVAVYITNRRSKAGS
jgi:drug/metabolite transporter (DMT)-like permease